MERYAFKYSINLEGPETPVTGSFTAVDELEQKVVQHVELEALNREGLKAQAQTLKNIFLAQKIEEESRFENTKKAQSAGTEKGN